SSTSQTATMEPKREAFCASPWPWPPQPISPNRNGSLRAVGAERHSSTYHKGSPAAAAKAPADLKNPRRETDQSYIDITLSLGSSGSAAQRLRCTAASDPGWEDSVDPSRLAISCQPTGCLQRQAVGRALAHLHVKVG